jgi:BirA family biotin operon repressor/biotin-[acetyl-CoA-carboxylase] ligase
VTNHSDKSKRLLPDTKKLESMAVERSLAVDFEVFETIDSTQTYLLAQPASQLPAGRTVLAGVQTSGKGRLDRTWSTDEGAALLLSTVLRIDSTSRLLPILPLVVGVAAVHTLAHVVTDVKLKWPNDIVISTDDDMFKLGGIVIAIHPDSGSDAVCVVGIGINLTMDAHNRPVENARALSDFTDKQIHYEALAVTLLSEINVLLTEQDIQKIESRYKELCCSLGQHVRVSLVDGSTFEGVATGIAVDGSLEVDVDGVTRRFHSADAQHLRTI